MKLRNIFIYLLNPVLGNKSKSKRVIPQIKPLRNVKKGSLSIFSKKEKG